MLSCLPITVHRVWISILGGKIKKHVRLQSKSGGVHFLNIFIFIVTCISAARSRRLYCSCLVEGAGCLLQGAGVAVKLVVGIYIVIG